jgi:hypothetical protein
MSITVALRPHENPRIDALTDAECLQWVLEFIRRDLDTVPPGELEAIGDDLRHATVPSLMREKPCIDMPASQVRALQHEIRQGIQATFAESVSMADLTRISSGQKTPTGWTIQLSAVHVFRVGYDCPGGYFRILCVGEHTDEGMDILIGVVNLLSKFGDRLRTCQVCGTPFLRQYRQEYCTVRCSNKVRNRRRLDRMADQRKSQGHGVTRVPDATSLTTA